MSVVNPSGSRGHSPRSFADASSHSPRANRYSRMSRLVRALTGAIAHSSAGLFPEPAAAMTTAQIRGPTKYDDETRNARAFPIPDALTGNIGTATHSTGHGKSA